MGKILNVLLSSLFLVGVCKMTYAANDNVSQQIQMLNSQIQAQMAKVQADQQKQILTFNTQMQAQIKQVQTELQAQIQKANAQTQSQIMLLQTTLQQQIKTVQQQATQTKH